MALYTDLVAAVRDALGRRAHAYRAVFNIESPQAGTVLVDLARFCRANTSTAHPDPHVAARLDGRREVWLRIQQHIKLDDETLWKLYGGDK